MVGFGSIGRGVLPLILRHIGVTPDRMVIVTAEEEGRREAQLQGIRFLLQPLTRENYHSVLEPLIGEGDFLLNLSVDVSSLALIKLCHEKGALYLDTCNEPWPGRYTDVTLSPSMRSNYALREEALELRERLGAGPDRCPDPWCKSGACVAFRQAGLAQSGRGQGNRGDEASQSRGVGRVGGAAWRQGHPYRRARHAGVADPKARRRVRQHMVRRRIYRRGLPTSGAWLG